MNRIRLFLMATMLMFALAVAAQQTNTSAVNSASVQGQNNAHPVVPTADEQLKVLAPRLELTSDQQHKIRPMLQDLHRATAKLVLDESLSRQERHNKLMALRYKTDAQVRTILTDDQKQKLDVGEHEPHPELHGNLNE